MDISGRGVIFGIIICGVIGWFAMEIFEKWEEDKAIEQAAIIAQQEFDAKVAEKQRKLEAHIERIWTIGEGTQELNEDFKDSLHSHILLITRPDSLGPIQIVEAFLGNWFYNVSTGEITIVFAGEVTKTIPIEETDTFLIWENVDLK